jgi:thiamine-phosphate pyrophosphorylase
MVQYRAKRNATRDQALALCELCRAMAIPFIVNDDPVLAKAIGADGVHLGKDDMPLHEAREFLGAERIIGVSCYGELTRAETAAQAGADYVAFGSFFFSSTKPGAVRAPQGLLQQARRLLKLPIVAIGGITPENGGALLAAGADLLAVANGVFGPPDPQRAAQRYNELFRDR